MTDINGNDNDYWAYLLEDGAKWHRARMLHYRDTRKKFKKGTKVYKYASRLEQKHAILFWEHMNMYKELK